MASLKSEHEKFIIDRSLPKQEHSQKNSQPQSFSKMDKMAFQSPFAHKLNRQIKNIVAKLKLER
jgi:hypothetical protein